ncbi:MAG TPA: HEAT repeat domain-containing protein [Gemmatimonadales bacterium]|nr:HEAT repeat domain-containing protein [Gemmatimonadales bacterium]
MSGSDAMSPAVRQFVRSTMLSMDQWRDGEGYDTSMFRGLSQPEAACILDLLNERLADSGAGWRDVDAMAELGIPPARMAMQRLARHPKAEVRLRAARHLAAWGDPSSAEREIVTLLRDADTDIGADALMAMAEHHPSVPVRKALLDCAVDGAEHLRVHAAALALFLAGGAAESFDWEHRPLFLEFGEPDRATRIGALQKLKRLMRS